MKRYLSLATLAVLLILMAGCASHESGDAERSGGPGRPGGSEAHGGPGNPDGPGGPVTAEQQADQLRMLLKLSDEQAAAVLPVLKDKLERRKAIMDEAGSGKSGREAMQQKVDDLEWDTDKKLALILTEEQMVAYSKWRDAEAEKKPTDDRPEPPSGGPGGRPGPGRP